MTIDLNTILGILVSVLLAILTGQVRGSRADTKAFGTKLDNHILEVAKAMAQKVDIGGCAGIRRDCVSLNKKIIAEPVDKALEDIEDRRREAWERQMHENRAMWRAIRGHAHTELPNREKDKVILPANGNP